MNALSQKLLQERTAETYAELGIEQPEFKRNLMQTQNGGYDLVGIDFLAIEVKRCETLALDKWWEQTVRQCGKDQIPILIYKQNRVRKWRVRMPADFKLDNNNSVTLTADISEDDFFCWLNNKLQFTL